MKTERRQADPLLQLLVGLGIGLAVVTAGLALLQKSTMVLAEMPFFVPMIHGFAVLETFTIAFLTIGRYRAQRDAVTYWVGTAFLSFSIANTFYIFTWPGLLANGAALVGHLADTPAWIIMAGQILFASLIIVAALVRWPGEQALKGKRSWVSLAAGLILILSINLLPPFLEGRLPHLVDPAGKYLPLMIILNFWVILLYAVGMIVSTRRYLRSSDRLSGYIALDALFLFASSVESILAGQRYDLLWYTTCIVAILGGMIVMLGLLWEYVHLYQGEQARRRELETSLVERQRAEERLAFQAKILANITDVVYATDANLTLTFWNHAAEKLYGWKEQEVLGKNIFELVKSKFDPDMRARLSRELLERDSVTAEVEHETRSGRAVQLESTTMLLPGEDGTADGYVSVNHDISERKRAEREIQQHVEALRCANEELTQFNHAMIGRELRMVELKKEVDELCEQAGQTKRYFPVPEK
jgi:PAS domain S-box-containing protein